MRFQAISPEEAHDLSERTCVPLTSDMIGASVVDDGRTLASVVLCNFTENSCWIHMVVYDSKVHEKNFFADEILGFTFKTANRKMALTTTSSLNEGSLALQKAYGFQEVARIPDAFSDGEDLILSKLTREDYMKRRGH